MRRPFICRNASCQAASASYPIQIELLEASDEPKCPSCGDKDSFQPADQVRTLLPEPSFVVKDSGKHQEFGTGARRDTQDGKGDFSRVPLTWLHGLAKELQRREDAHDRL